MLCVFLISLDLSPPSRESGHEALIPRSRQPGRPRTLTSQPRAEGHRESISVALIFIPYSSALGRLPTPWPQRYATSNDPGTGSLIADSQSRSDLHDGRSLGVELRCLLADAVWEPSGSKRRVRSAGDLVDGTAMDAVAGGDLLHGHAIEVIGDDSLLIREAQTGLRLKRISDHGTARVSANRRMASTRKGLLPR